ncbi:putative Borrelia P83/100 protein [Marseillevirus Shanghai 1]|nr:putative Borrelia P83/100 protein [Marseillevirus Shanghai 1]
MDSDEYSESEREFSEQEEEQFEQDVETEDDEAVAEQEEEEIKRFERELEVELEEEPEKEEDLPIIPGTKKDEDLALAEEEAERQAKRLQKLGYDVIVVPIGVGSEPGGEEQKRGASGRLGYTPAERKLLGLPPVQKKVGKVLTERVSTKKTKATAKRRGAVREMIGKSERTVYGAKRIGTVRLVGTHLEEDVDVYKYEEKPYDRFVELVKRWEKRYATEKGVNKPISRASIPTISRVLKDEEKSKKRRVYDIPLVYRDFAVLQKRSEDIQKILDEVKEQKKLLTREKLPEGGRLRFPKPEERLQLSKEEREEMNQLEREIFEAAEEARNSLAPRTEAGKFLVSQMERIEEEREKAELLPKKQRQKFLEDLEEQEKKAKDEAVLLRTKLASTMGIAPKKRGTILIGAEIKERGSASRKSPTKKTDFAFAAWRKTRSRDEKTRKFARDILGIYLNRKGAKLLEEQLDISSKTTGDYIQKLAEIQLLLDAKNSVSKKSRVFHRVFTPGEDITTVRSLELFPEYLLGPDASKFRVFLKKRSDALSGVIKNNEEWSDSLLSQLPKPEKFLALPEEEAFLRYILASSSPSAEIREATLDVCQKVLPGKKLDALETALVGASGVNTKYYIRRIALVLGLLTKTLSLKTPYLQEKLKSGLYEMGAIALVPEEELAPEYLLDKALRKEFLEHVDKLEKEFAVLVAQELEGEDKKPYKLSSGASLPYPPKLQEKCSNPDALEIPLGNIVMCYSEGVFHCFDVEKEIKSFIKTGKFIDPSTKKKLPDAFVKKMRQRYER